VASPMVTLPCRAFVNPKDPWRDKTMTEDTETPTTQAEVSSTASSEPAQAETSTLPALDFATFILSLSSSVLINLGILENPITKKSEKDIKAAKQTIDLIALLKEKTGGNLTEDESKLIGDLLTELQLQYCRSTEG